MDNSNTDENVELLDVNTSNQKKVDYSDFVNVQTGIDPGSIGNVDLSKKEDIGLLPPELEPDKKKKNGLKKFLFVLIVLISMAVVAFGVYYYLSLANSRAKKRIITNDLVLNLNDELSTNPLDYATFNGISSTNCYVNTNEVDVSTPGDYKYYIVCGNEKYDGNIKIADNEGPKVTLKTVLKNVNENVTADEFIAGCDDDSECTYAFDNESTVKEYLTKVGNYKVGINVTDSSSNTSKVEANLIVVDGEVSKYLSCSGDLAFVDGYNAIKITYDKFALDENDNFIGYAKRVVVYSFSNTNEYNELKNKKSEGEFLDSKGEVKFDDSKYEVSVESGIDDVSSFKDLNGIKTQYQGKSYNCSIAK